MRTLDYILCDDNIVFLDKLKKLIDDYNFKYNANAYVHTFTNYGKEFYEKMHEASPQKVYILDIETPSKSGLDVAREIRKFDYHSIIIFISTHSDMARNISMDLLNVLTFIPKFDDFERRILLAINKVQEMMKSKNKFFFKEKETTYYIHYDEILYITYDSNIRKSIIVTNDYTYEAPISLKTCYQRLNHEFKYSHRSCIVNKNRIKESTKEQIVFDNCKKIDLISDMFYEKEKVY